MKRISGSMRQRIVLTLIMAIVLSITDVVSAQEVATTSLAQSFGWYESVTSTSNYEFSTTAHYSDQHIHIDAGLRGQPPVWDVAVNTQLILDHNGTASGNKIIGHLHSALTCTTGAHMDAVVGFKRRIGFYTDSFTISLSYGFGVQVSATFMPSLNDPLFNFNPYYDIHVDFDLLKRVHVSAAIASSTLFEYSSQAMSPIFIGTVDYHLTNRLVIGCAYSLHFSDIMPEVCIITKQEAKAYVEWIVPSY